jgi:hypothetical protein
MDDSKLANGPVKVRCAKCKEVFVVRPEEPVTASVAPSLPEPAPAPAPAEHTDPSEFSFDTPADSDNSATQGADDFSFDIETPAVNDKAASGQSVAANEFDWQTAKTPDSADSDVESRFDLSSFDASLDAPNEAPVPASAPAEDNDFDFGEVDFSTTNAPAEESSIVTGSSDSDDFSMDFGEVSFSDQSAEESRPDTSSAGVPDADNAFPDEQTSVEESAAADDFLLSFNSDSEKQASSAATDKKPAEKVNFADFSFADKGDSADAKKSDIGAILPDQSQDDFAATGFSDGDLGDEPPPASLTSRKKSGSFFPLIVIVGAILLIIALAGSGVYFFGGPKAFSKVGLGFLVEWYGDKGAEEGSIALKGVTASYTVNSTAGELFVVRGEAVNNYKKPRASIQVKVTLLGPGGVNLVSKSVYCGNSLTNEQLATLPLEKIEEIMNNQFGDSLANLGIKPEASIPFVIVVSPLPKEATDYSVVVGGSTVATQ